MLNHLISITVSNYRSILDPVTIPLSEKFTFLVGGNNSGKTSILRIMAHMFHGREGLVSDDDPVGASEKTLAKTNMMTSAMLMPQFKQFKNFYQLCKASTVNEFSLLHRFYDKTPTFELNEDIFEITSKGYFVINGAVNAQSHFMDDFKNGGDVDFNLNYAGKTLVKYGIIPTTIHVPSQRAILNSGAGISQFGQLPWPGNSIEMETIVAQLDALLRNSGSRQERLDANKKVADICNFLQYCLEVEQVSLQVPQNSETILIKIGNLENPISHVGSGIEQLLLLAIASFTFKDTIVLMDEPELHLHPRTQKRMMKFLSENSNAKFVIATHSAAMLNLISANIVQVKQNNGQCSVRSVQNKSDHYEAIRNLGHSPSELVLANFVVWVEGPSDRIYINHEKRRAFARQLGEYRLISPQHPSCHQCQHRHPHCRQRAIERKSIGCGFPCHFEPRRCARSRRDHCIIQRCLGHHWRIRSRHAASIKERRHAAQHRDAQRAAKFGAMFPRSPTPSLPVRAGRS